MYNDDNIFVETDRCSEERVGADPVNAILLSCLYSKGNGIYLHASKAHKGEDRWSTMFWSEPWTHARVLLHSMPRGNAKIFGRYERAIRECAKDIADAFIDKDTERMRSIVLRAL